MTLDTFKKIWKSQYWQNMLDQLLGVAFLAPCAYFWYSGRFNYQMKVRMGVAGTLIASKVLYNIWMAKVAKDPRKDADTHIRRIPYRFMTQIASAYAIYGIFLTSAFSNLFTPFNISLIELIFTVKF
jgi:heme A synthase